MSDETCPSCASYRERIIAITDEMYAEADRSESTSEMLWARQIRARLLGEQVPVELTEA